MLGSRESPDFTNEDIDLLVEWLGSVGMAVTACGSGFTELVERQNISEQAKRAMRNEPYRMDFASSSARCWVQRNENP
jgi:hypothetical protein